jgi:hypothetical protein
MIFLNNPIYLYRQTNHTMSNKEESIQKALGIPEKFATDAEEILQRLISEYEKVSEILIAAGEEIRTSELGDINVPLSTYEKKLLLIGFYLGSHIGKFKSDPTMGILGAILRMGRNSEEEEEEEG